MIKESKVDIKSLDLNELTEFLESLGEKAFREQLESFNSRNARNYGGSDKDFFLDLPLEQDPKNPYVYYFKNGTKYIMDATDKKRQTRLTFKVR